MKTLDSALKLISRWHGEGCVGNLVVFRAPRSQNVDIVGEQTIKMRELDRETQETIRNLFSLVDSEKIELFRDKDGIPDRIRIVRRY